MNFISLNAGTGPCAEKLTETGALSIPFESIAIAVILWLPGVREEPSATFA